MHDSDSSISEIEWPRRTEKSCIALKSSASVAKQHGTYSDLSSTPQQVCLSIKITTRMAILAHKRKVMKQVCFWRSKWGIPGSFCLRYHWTE